MIFALFFLAEYSNILFMCSFISILFFGGPKIPLIFFKFLYNTYKTIFLCISSISLSLKIGFFVFLFILVRASYPRYRYDQLMTIA